MSWEKWLLLVFFTSLAVLNILTYERAVTGRRPPLVKGSPQFSLLLNLMITAGLMTAVVYA